MYLRDGDCGVHILGEGILKEVCICPAKDASVVGVELYVDDLQVTRSSDSDSGGEFNFYRGFRVGYHGVCVGVCHGYDKIGELRGCLFAKV